MSASRRGWIGVDLDGTLARYTEWQGHTHIGQPIPVMVARVKQWIADGRDVRIFTARVAVVAGQTTSDTLRRLNEAREARDAIGIWCVEHLGQALPITYTKDYGMIELWDDRCVQVEPNTGRRVDGREG